MTSRAPAQSAAATSCKCRTRLTNEIRGKELLKLKETKKIGLSHYKYKI